MKISLSEDTSGAKELMELENRWRSSPEDFDELYKKRDNIVFVYGTLKEGYSNHKLLLEEKYLGKAGTTTDQYLLFDGVYPIACKKTNGTPRNLTFRNSVILGECYAVSPQTMIELDSLEGHPTWYAREEVLVDLYDQYIFKNYHKNKSQKKNFLTCKAWIYLMNCEDKSCQTRTLCTRTWIRERSRFTTSWEGNTRVYKSYPSDTFKSIERDQRSTVKSQEFTSNHQNWF